MAKLAAEMALEAEVAMARAREEPGVLAVTAEPSEVAEAETEACTAVAEMEMETGVGCMVAVGDVAASEEAPSAEEDADRIVASCRSPHLRCGMAQCMRR